VIATAYRDAKRFLSLRPFAGSLTITTYDPIELLEQLIKETEQERKLLEDLRTQLRVAQERVERSEQKARRMLELLQTQVNHRKLSRKKFKEVCAIK
jgi:hypothetical protein